MIVLTDVLGCVLVVVLAAKAYSISKDNEWIRLHGKEFATHIGQAAGRALVEGDMKKLIFEFYDLHGGGHLPFGVKQYRLTRWIDRLDRGVAARFAGQIMDVSKKYYSDTCT
jgi:hypothetical protein